MTRNSTIIYVTNQSGNEISQPQSYKYVTSGTQILYINKETTQHVGASIARNSFMALTHINIGVGNNIYTNYHRHETPIKMIKVAEKC